MNQQIAQGLLTNYTVFAGPLRAVGSESDCISRGRMFDYRILSLQFGHEHISACSHPSADSQRICPHFTVYGEKWTFVGTGAC